MKESGIRIKKIDGLSSFPFADPGSAASSMYENYLMEYRETDIPLDAAFIASRMNDKRISAVCTYEGKKPGLFVMYSQNDFDSSVLGKKCARVELFERGSRLGRERATAHAAAFSEKLASDGFGMLTARVRGSDFILCDALVGSGFVSVDELDIFWMRSGSREALCAQMPVGHTPHGAHSGNIKGKKRRSSVVLSDITPSIRGDVERLSGDSFLKSRYYNDPFVKKSVADKFYAKLASSFIDNTDGVRIAALHEGKLAGFIIGVENEFISSAIGRKFIYLYLIAVDGGHQGIGVGETLVRAFTSRCFEEGYEIIEVGTQSFNFRAAALYERCGYRKCEYLRTFHRHINEAGKGKGGK